jgi:hypothetical protein
MSPAQSAELVELFDHVLAVLREASEGAVMRPGAERVEIDFAHWQGILDLQAKLAEMLRAIADPRHRAAMCAPPGAGTPRLPRGYTVR